MHSLQFNLSKIITNVSLNKKMYVFKRFHVQWNLYYGFGESPRFDRCPDDVLFNKKKLWFNYIVWACSMGCGMWVRPRRVTVPTGLQISWHWHSITATEGSTHKPRVFYIYLVYMCMLTMNGIFYATQDRLFIILWFRIRKSAHAIRMIYANV